MNHLVAFRMPAKITREREREREIRSREMRKKKKNEMHDPHGVKSVARLIVGDAMRSQYRWKRACPSNPPSHVPRTRGFPRVHAPARALPFVPRRFANNHRAPGHAWQPAFKKKKKKKKKERRNNNRANAPRERRSRIQLIFSIGKRTRGAQSGVVNSAWIETHFPRTEARRCTRLAIVSFFWFFLFTATTAFPLGARNS